MGCCVAEYGAGLDADPTYLIYVGGQLHKPLYEQYPAKDYYRELALLEGLAIPRGLASQKSDPATPSIKFQRSR